MVFPDSSSITCPLSLRSACLKRGSFARPALPGFMTTMTLSEAQASRHPCDDVWYKTAGSGLPLLTQITFSACRAHYPGGSVRCFSVNQLARSRAGLFPNRSGLPAHNERSASTVFVSRPARASLVLRPADLLTHLSWAWLRGSDEIRYQTPSLVSYPGIPRSPGEGLSPSGVSRRKGARRVEERRECRTIRAFVPFPFPAHQTGRADFPHPAFRQTSSRAHAGASLRP